MVNWLVSPETIVKLLHNIKSNKPVQPLSATNVLIIMNTCSVTRIEIFWNIAIVCLYSTSSSFTKESKLIQEEILRYSGVYVTEVQVEVQDTWMLSLKSHAYMLEF